MSFIVLLLLSLSALVSVEIATTQHSQAQLAARENARLAVMIALGELQKHAGPDQRVTARAEILGDGNYHESAKNWTGIWNATNTSTPTGWFVTGMPTTSTSITQPSIEIVPEYDLNADGVIDHEAVLVPLKTAPTREGLPGNYGWWVSDENTKASVQLVSNVNELSNDWLTSLTDEEKDRTRFNIPERTGFEYTVGIFDENNRDVLFDAEDPKNKQRIEAILDPKDLQNLSGIDQMKVANRFHDLTTMSLGVLTKTDGTPGLRKDLSLNPSLLGDAFSNYMKFTDYLLNPEDTSEILGRDIISDKTDLRRLHKITAPSTSSPTQGEIVHSVAPVITDFGIQFGFKVNTSDYPNVIIAMKSGLEMWNPYSTGLVPEDMTLEVSGLEPITITPSHSDTGIESSPIEIDPHEYYGDPIIFHLRFDNFDSSAKISANSYDAKVWGPGRIVYWVGTSGNLSSTETYTPQAMGFGQNNASKSYYKDTGIDYPESDIPKDKLEISYDIPETNMSVVLKKASTDGVLTTYSGLDFWEVEESAPYTATEWSNNHVGFQFRMRERGGTVDSDPSLWLKHSDMRVPNPHLDLSENLDDYDAIYVWREDVHPAELPTSYLNTMRLSQGSAPEYQFYRSPASTSVWHSSFRRDLPLFELPRQPLISLGSLQHIQVGQEPPFSYGNSWGGDLNDVFDLYFLSGIQHGISEPDLTVAKQLPNPRLVIANPAASRFDDITTQDIIDAGEDSAMFFLVEGAFNINSTSVDAWEAILTSNSLKSFSFVDRDENLMDDINTDESNLINSVSGEPYDMPPTFVRFPQSFQEHFQRDINTFNNPLTHSPNQFYHRGFKVMAERTAANDDPDDYAMGNDSFARSLATEIVNRIKIHNRPFSSLKEFLSAPATDEQSLIEEALSAVSGIHKDKILQGSNLVDVDIEERTPAFLTQADIMNALAPIISNRSDTFIIRGYGDIKNPMTGDIIGEALCEALVQRIVTPTEENADLSQNTELLDPQGALGRQFVLLDFKWLSESEI